jgi:hypothetical protein
VGLIFSKTWVGNQWWIPSPFSSQQNFCGNWQPQGQQTGTNHSYSSIWIQQTALYGQGRVSWDLWCHVGLIFSKTWVGNQWWTPSVSKTSVVTDSPRDITNRNQPLLLLHMDPTNTTVWTRKSFIGSVVCGLMQCWFSAKLGLEISDWSWIQQTPLYGQGRVSLALWCHVGLIFSKMWAGNHSDWPSS